MQRGQAREGLRSQAQERLWSRHLRAVDPQAYQGDSAIVHAMKVYDHVIATDMKGISRDLEELTSAVLLLGARLQGVAYSVFRGNEEEPTPSPFRIAEGAGAYESDCVWAWEIDGSSDDKQDIKDRLLGTGKGLRDSLFSNTLTYRPLIGVYAAQAMDLVTVRCRCGPYVDGVRDCTRAIMFGSHAVLQTIYVEDRHHKKVMLCESGTRGLLDDVHSKRGTFQVHEVSVGREGQWECRFVGGDAITREMTMYGETDGLHRWAMHRLKHHLPESSSARSIAWGAVFCDPAWAVFTAGMTGADGATRVYVASATFNRSTQLEETAMVADATVGTPLPGQETAGAGCGPRLCARGMGQGSTASIGSSGDWPGYATTDGSEHDGGTWRWDANNGLWGCSRGDDGSEDDGTGSADDWQHGRAPLDTPWGDVYGCDTTRSTQHFHTPWHGGNVMGGD